MDTIVQYFNTMINNNFNLTQNIFSNRNIVDNWYFGNPVNQRGKTSTNANGYFLDRWYCIDLMNSATVSLNNNSIAISATANGTITIPRITQLVENPSNYGSKTITFSMKYKLSGKGSIWAEDMAESQNRWLYQELPASQDWKLFKFTFATRSDITKLQISISLGTLTVNSETDVAIDTLTEDSTLEIEAVKMEIGDRQTLAHLENGVWVLNEIPNYAEELAKCQRRQIFGYIMSCSITTVGNEAWALVSTPVPLAKDVSPSLVGTWEARALSGNGVVGSGISIERVCANSVIIKVSGCNVPCYVHTTNGGIDCNL